MHTIADLLDAASVKLNHATDYRLAKELGVHNQYLYRWRSGETWPNNDQLCTLAHLLGISPYYAIACMVIARGGEKNEAYWRASAEREPESVKTVNQLLQQTAAACDREAQRFKERAREIRARARRGAASILLAAFGAIAAGSPAPSAAYAGTAQAESPPSVYYVKYGRNRRRRERRRASPPGLLPAAA